MRLKQLRMRAEPLELNSTGFFIKLVNKHPIALYVAVTRFFPFALKRMVPMVRRQWFFTDKHSHYLNELVHVSAAFFICCKFLFEFAGANGVKHSLTPKIKEQFFKGVKLLCRRFVGFLNCGDGFGIRYQCSAGRIAVLGTKRTFMQVGFFRSRSKGYYCRSRLNFTRNLKCYPAVKRDFYGLCHSHILNIPQKAA